MRLNRELQTLRARMDAAYMDKLDGRIPEEFWQRKQAEWQAEELRVISLISGIDEAKTGERLLDAQKILGLPQTAHSLYVTQKPAEQAELLRKVVLNCSIDAVSLYPTYRKPFDLIFNRAKSEEWLGRRDSNPRPSAPKSVWGLSLALRVGASGPKCMRGKNLGLVLHRANFRRR